MSNIKNQYVPDCVSPPGETLEEMLAERQMPQVEFALRISMSRNNVKQILEGDAPITPETALKFERVLGIPARFWNNRENIYRDFLARKAESEKLEKYKDWLKNFKHIPLMKRRTWLPNTEGPIDTIRALLDFFGVASTVAWEEQWRLAEAHYRRSRTHESDLFALATWLRRGEIQAQGVDCAPYNEAKFREALAPIKKLTIEEPSVFQKRLVNLCAECGVAVVFVPELPKTASGATRWLSSSKALIQLSLRYKTDDQLWFTFFHEAGHILLHPKKDIFIETKGLESEKEGEADRFAARLLIPDTALDSLLSSPLFAANKNEAIRAFARQQGIAPGIVVGRLQHDRHLPFSSPCNHLKRRFEWAKTG